MQEGKEGLVKDVVSGIQTTIQKNLDSGNVTCEYAKGPITKAELIWAMKSVSSHFGYSASYNIKVVLNAMFPGKIPANFTMSSSKLSYLISDGTGTYFNSLMVKDITKSRTPYSIHFDKTTNNQGHKQLDIKIRYWSNNQNKIVSFIISELTLWIMPLDSNLRINLFHHYRKIISL